MHEVVFDDQFQLKNDISTLDIAKKIIDYGYHPPTIYFPLIIKGALMIEPTETESLETIDEFCEALIEIANLAKEDNAKEKHFENCPRGTPFAKVDETEAARNLRLSWRDL